MSAAKLRFQVDSRLATLLSQEYKSTERALKELVDNAWDADADQVSIQLPKPMSGEPIVIRDDGTGMTEEELRRHYLTIAKDRRSSRGERTVGKNRQVKGRKGIGKFAGFMAASVMTLETSTRGRLCRIALRLDAIGKVEDIEHLDIALHSEDCDPGIHGTVITLRETLIYSQFPTPSTSLNVRFVRFFMICSVHHRFLPFSGHFPGIFPRFRALRTQLSRQVPASVA